MESVKSAESDSVIGMNMIAMVVSLSRNDNNMMKNLKQENNIQGL